MGFDSDYLSSATANWDEGNGGTLVGALGTPANLLAELASGVSSRATLLNRENLMAWGLYFDSASNVTVAGALWWSPRSSRDYGWTATK